MSEARFTALEPLQAAGRLGNRTLSPGTLGRYRRPQEGDWKFGTPFSSLERRFL